ncbi:hypothetical protein B0T24DRAFT_632961 [Lasiosphaeria ovina]|uniref:Uncharacterized protein n=1 Tax=Lasiosphaeria ovina TaxID=92902 RepID=A0AAE0K430_9PEZI|nr:hypothetical protein B0T24DRAFT_632961 [Lasiosphaeria ovina]
MSFFLFSVVVAGVGVFFVDRFRMFIRVGVCFVVLFGVFIGVGVCFVLVFCLGFLAGVAGADYYVSSWVAEGRACVSWSHDRQHLAVWLLKAGGLWFVFGKLATGLPCGSLGESLCNPGIRGG